MSLPVRVEHDGETAQVRSGALVVTMKGSDVEDITQAEAERVKVWTALMEDANGSTDLTIDGSATAVEFTFSPDAEKMVRVQSMRLVFHSSNMDISSNESRRFGPVIAPGLANGIKLEADQGGVLTPIFLSPVQVLGDFYRYAGGSVVGINTGIVNDRDAISAGVDFFMILVVLPVPVILFPGSSDRIVLTIQDDLTGITLFEVQGYGTQE